GSRAYQGAVKGIVRRSVRFMAIFGVLCIAMVMMFMRVPSSFLPEEDQGVLFSMVKAPVGATQERTMESIMKLEEHFLQNEQDTVESVFSVQGFSFGGSGQNNGMAFIKLKDWDERESPEMSAAAVAGRAMAALSQVKDAFIFAFAPPAIPELGTASGFAFYLKDNVNQVEEAFTQAGYQILTIAGESPLLSKELHSGMDDSPQLRVHIDMEKASPLGLAVADINPTLAAAWGGQYID